MKKKVKPETKYSQCNYNAIATIFNEFYGYDTVEDDKWEVKDGKPTKVQDGYFISNLPSDLKGYYGWIPYATDMIGSMMENSDRWNDTEIDVEMDKFSVTGGDVKYIGNTATRIGDLPVFEVTYSDDEFSDIINGLASKLEDGPCLLWIPWAAYWGNVWDSGNGSYKSLGMPNTTHAIALTGYNEEKNTFYISDNSSKDGDFEVSAHDLVTKLSIMPFMQRERDKNGTKLKGIENEEFHTHVKKK